MATPLLVGKDRCLVHDTAIRVAGLKNPAGRCNGGLANFTTVVWGPVRPAPTSDQTTSTAGESRLLEAAQLRTTTALNAVDTRTRAVVQIPAETTITLASTQLRGVVQVVWRERLLSVFASDLRRKAEVVRD
jgi:hypothetical protein